MSKESQVAEAKNIVTIQDAGPCKKKLSVEIAEETIKNSLDEQYRDLRKEAMVPGFRKGRAPLRLLEKKFGREITEQVKLKLLADASDSAIKDNNLDTLGEPDIDYENITLPESGTLKFDFEVEVRPEFDLPMLENIPINKPKLQIANEQVTKEIEQLQRRAGIWAPQENGTVEVDDQIIADVVLKAEGTEEEDKLDNIQIYVRQNGFVGGVAVEKLDELLAGARAGDVRKTTVNVPKTYHRQEYRGKKVDIQITIKDIKRLRPAELNEDFFKKFGIEDETELRERVHDMLGNQLEQQSRALMRDQVYKYLLDNTNFDLPANVVADQSERLFKRQYTNLMIRGLNREQIEEQMEQLRASSEEEAKKELKMFFIMGKVAEKLEIKVSDEEVNGYIAQVAAQRGRRPEKMREELIRDGSLAQFSLQVREEKCIGKLLESAKITEVKPLKKPKSSRSKTSATRKKKSSTRKATTKKKKSGE